MNCRGLALTLSLTCIESSKWHAYLGLSPLQLIETPYRRNTRAKISHRDCRKERSRNISTGGHNTTKKAPRKTRHQVSWYIRSKKLPLRWLIISELFRPRKYWFPIDKEGPQAGWEYHNHTNLSIESDHHEWLFYFKIWNLSFTSLSPVLSLTPSSSTNETSPVCAWDFLCLKVSCRTRDFIRANEVQRCWPFLEFRLLHFIDWVSVQLTGVSLDYWLHKAGRTSINIISRAVDWLVPASRSWGS